MDAAAAAADEVDAWEERRERPVITARRLATWLAIVPNPRRRVTCAGNRATFPGTAIKRIAVDFPDPAMFAARSGTFLVIARTAIGMSENVTTVVARATFPVIAPKMTSFGLKCHRLTPSKDVWPAYHTTAYKTTSHSRESNPTTPTRLL